MTDSKQVVGEVFEGIVADLFNLKINSNGSTKFIPDLISEDGDLHMEVKSALYSNGGVIRRNQLKKFYRTYGRTCFYAFAYHSVKNIERKAMDEETLRDKLSLKSLYVFPINVVSAHFRCTPKRKTTHNSDFVQLRESLAKKIFEMDDDAWKKLNIGKVGHTQKTLHENIFVLNRKDYSIDQKLMESFNPSYI